MQTLQEFQDEIVGKSVRLKLVRSSAEKAIAAAMLTRSDLWQCQQEASRKRAKQLIRKQILDTCKENNVGSIMVIIAILGIIINLIWQWWLHKQEAQQLRSAEQEWDDWLFEAKVQLAERS